MRTDTLMELRRRLVECHGLALSAKQEDIDFDLSLTENLARNQVIHQKDTQYEGRQKWFCDGEYLGSFTAQEGWMVLRHYNLIGRWDLAIKAADREMKEGYGYSQAVASEVSA